MGKGPEQAFFQRRHPNGQKVHEKKLNITNYQASKNQNHNEISPHPYQNGYYQEHKRYKVLARMWRKGNAWHCWWECKLVQPLCKTGWNFLKKIKTELPYDL